MCPMEPKYLDNLLLIFNYVKIYENSYLIFGNDISFMFLVELIISIPLLHIILC